MCCTRIIAIWWWGYGAFQHISPILQLSHIIILLANDYAIFVDYLNPAECKGDWRSGVDSMIRSEDSGSDSVLACIHPPNSLTYSLLKYQQGACWYTPDTEDLASVSHLCSKQCLTMYPLSINALTALELLSKQDVRWLKLMVSGLEEKSK